MTVTVVPLGVAHPLYVHRRDDDLRIPNRPAGNWNDGSEIEMGKVVRILRVRQGHHHASRAVAVSGGKNAAHIDAIVVDELRVEFLGFRHIHSVVVAIADRGHWGRHDVVGFEGAPSGDAQIGGSVLIAASAAPMKAKENREWLV